MKHSEFNQILKQRLEKISTVLESKAAEYSTSDNRLHNFEVAGRINSAHPKCGIKKGGGMSGIGEVKHFTVVAIRK